MTFVEEYGYLGLFVFSFLSASLIPVSSEGAMLGALYLDMAPVPVLVWASLGNCLAIMLNFGLGRWGSTAIETRAHSNRVYKAASTIMRKYGWISLLISWVPLIGDPITVLAGVFRIKPWVFLCIAPPLRVARYYLILHTFLG